MLQLGPVKRGDKKRADRKKGQNSKMMKNLWKNREKKSSTARIFKGLELASSGSLPDSLLSIYSAKHFFSSLQDGFFVGPFTK
jgi:hypothetical protein